ncbi:MAG TPA: hypothetical protein VGR26_02490, partial [Acidimicrobiales bacterium]|nr:hypothetical protein [Acidimicrobiales bacterium]
MGSKNTAPRNRVGTASKPARRGFPTWAVVVAGAAAVLVGLLALLAGNGDSPGSGATGAPDEDAIAHVH